MYHFPFHTYDKRLVSDVPREVERHYHCHGFVLFLLMKYYMLSSLSPICYIMHVHIYLLTVYSSIQTGDSLRVTFFYSSLPLPKFSNCRSYLAVISVHLYRNVGNKDMLLLFISKLYLTSAI